MVVSIVELKSISLEKVKNSMLKMLDQLDYYPTLDKILIKPNIVDAVNPNEAVITHPIVVGGLILALDERLRSKGRSEMEYVIGENSGFFSMNDVHFKHLIKTTQYARLLRKIDKIKHINVKIINLDKVEQEELEWPYGKGMLKIPKMLKCYTYINLAKMKTHILTEVSLTTKNQKGLLLFGDKKAFHRGYNRQSNLHECITQLNKIIKPELSVIDAYSALEGSGPATLPGGQTNVRFPKLIIGGTDNIEVDNVAVQIMGIPVGEISHIPYKKVSLAEASLPIIPIDPPFARSQKISQRANLYTHHSDWMCTSCMINISRMFRKIMFTPKLKEKFYRLQEKYPEIKLYVGKMEGRDIDPNTEIDEKEIPEIFFGHCVKSDFEMIKEKYIKKDGGTGKLSSKVLFVPGCPGDHIKSIEQLFSLLDDDEDDDDD